MLSREDLAKTIRDWLAAWNRHDLTAVLAYMADDVVFEHWNGHVIRGKHQLERVWQPWFAAHGDFRFDIKAECIDQARQTFCFEWRLEWPSPEPAYRGQREAREGIDVIEFREREIIMKRTYIKTVLKINNRSILLKAESA